MTYYPRRWCRKFPNKMSRTEQTYHPLFVAVRQNAVHEIKSFWYRRKPEWWTANGAKRSSRNVWQSCSDYLSLFSLSSAGKKLNMFAVSVNDKSFLVRILKWRADPSSLLKKKKKKSGCSLAMFMPGCRVYFTGGISIMTAGKQRGCEVAVCPRRRAIQRR